MDGLAVAIGTDIGRLSHPPGSWWTEGAVLDADFANGRFRWDGRSFTDETSFLAAIDGVKSGNRRTINPYVLPGASELVTNPDFTTDLVGWTSVLNGTSTAAVVAGSAILTGDGTTGIGSGGAGITQDIATVADKAYAVTDKSNNVVVHSLRIGSTLYGGDLLALSLTPQNATLKTCFAAIGTVSKPYPYRSASGAGASIDSFSVKECSAFKGFEQGGCTIEVSGTTPAVAASNKTIACLHAGFDRHTLNILQNAAGEIHVVSRYRGGTIADLNLGVVAPSTAFKLRAGFKANEFYAVLNGNSPLFVDLVGAMPIVGQLIVGNDGLGTAAWDGGIGRLTVLPGGGIAQFAGPIALLHIDGDSFVGGAYGVVLPSTLATAMARPVYNTGVGGNSMNQISTRLATAPFEVRLKTTVIWDGDQNGLTSVAAYCDLLAAGLAALGHQRFVLIPPCTNYGQADVSQELAIRDEMLSRWPGNVLDWRGVLPMTAGHPSLPMFYDSSVDATHLSQAAMDLMATAIASFIIAKGW